MPDQLLSLWPSLHLAGRVLFASFFVIYGLTHLLRPEPVVEYFRQKEIPGPRPVTFATGLMLLAGGAFVLIGWSRFIGAGLLFLVLFPGAFALHPFWRETDPGSRMQARASFFMTIALAGASLFIAYYGYMDWPLAVVH